MSIIVWAMRIFVVVGILYLIVSLARAHPLECGKTEDFEKILRGRLQEVVAGVGIHARGRTMFRLYVSQDGTFTVLRTQVAGGQSCIMASGVGWETVEPNFDELDPES